MDGKGQLIELYIKIKIQIKPYGSSKWAIHIFIDTDIYTTYPLTK